MKNNAVGWFEIPVTDMDRAIKFYLSVFNFSMQKENLGGLEMTFFPWEEEGNGASGALVRQADHYKPSASEGVLIYFNSPTGDLQNELDNVEQAGGKILQPKTLITEDIGYMAIFLDSEGNRIAMHSRD